MMTITLFKQLQSALNLTVKKQKKQRLFLKQRLRKPLFDNYNTQNQEKISKKNRPVRKHRTYRENML